MSQDRQDRTGYVYFLAFRCQSCHEPHTAGNARNPRAQMSIYVGWTYDVGLRVHQHNAGKGAKSVGTIVARDLCATCGDRIQAVPIAFIAGDRTLERTVKNYRCARRWLTSHARTVQWLQAGLFAAIAAQYS